MNILHCMKTPPLKPSHPTTPLTLKGKRKIKKIQNNPSSFLIQPPSSSKQNEHSIGFWNKKKSKYFLGIFNKNQPPTQSIQSMRQLPTPSNQNKQHERGNQIRKKLDENLYRQYQALKDRRLSVNIDSRNLQSIKFIPKLQKNLVNQYIQLIYKDYLIVDPLTQRVPHQPQYPLITPSSLQTPQLLKQQIPIHRRSQYLKTRKSRKAVQLKQNFLVQMFNSQEPANQQYTHDGSSQIKSPEKHQSSSGNTMAHSFPIEEMSQEQSKEKQVSQVFRYCFICQQLILESNMEAHEREKCPQFNGLYRMSFKQIKSKLIEKIVRIKQQTQQLYKIIFENKNENKVISKLNILKKETINYLNNVNHNIYLSNCNINNNYNQNNNLNIEQQTCKNKLKYSFSNLMLSYQQSYFKLYQKLKKLHWFNLMLKNLQMKYQSNIQNFNQKDLFQLQHSKRNLSLNEPRQSYRPHKQVYLF